MISDPRREEGAHGEQGGKKEEKKADVEVRQAVVSEWLRVREWACMSVSCSWLSLSPDQRSGPARRFPNKLAGTCCTLGRPCRPPCRAPKLPATMQAGGRAASLKERAR